MAYSLPQCMAIKSKLSGRHAGYKTEPSGESKASGYVSCDEEKVFSPSVKIEVEVSETNSKYIHLRFSHSNRYWSRRGPGVNDRWIVASSKQPEEDTSKWSCTLFEPTFGNDGIIYLTHVQSRKRLGTDKANSWNVFVDDTSVSDPNSYAFTFIDWESLVIMPKVVAFKGYNGDGLYLRATWAGHMYQKLSAHDSNQQGTSYEIQMQPDGYLRILAHENGMFWRRSPNWIWADTTETSGHNKDTLFWPVKVEDNIIALRNAGNNHFCGDLSVDGKENCLNAWASTITREAKFRVEELILEREIYNVRYHMDDVRVFDQKIKIVGHGEAENASDEKATLAIKVAFQNVSSYTFTRNVTVKVGVKTSIKTGIPFIAEGKVEISGEISGAFTWSNTTTNTETQEATYTIPVPPRSRARINYLATQGTCSVPFSYTQKDQRSSDGHFETSHNIDGIFSGINYYSFHFDQPQFEYL